jgi:pyruvate formate lyase activating enzyme
MLVNFGGIVPLSTVDWVGRAAMVVFLRGCPLRCRHCHNSNLQDGESLVEISSIIKDIKKAAALEESLSQLTIEQALVRAKRKPLISALVLSGGEPLVQTEAVMALAHFAHSMGLKVGLETCGYYPDRIAVLLKEAHIDQVFLDVKARLREEDYLLATGRDGVAEKVMQSLEIIMQSGVLLETRTTIFPEMPSFSDVLEIAKYLETLSCRYPDNHLKTLMLQEGISRAGDMKSVSLEYLESLRRSIKGQNVQIKHRSQGKKAFTVG